MLPNRPTSRPRRCHPGVALIAALIGLTASCIADRRPVVDSPVGLALRWTTGACRAGAVDHDVDGLDDACELGLAEAFAPELVIDPSDCSWDQTARPARLAGGYLFAVQPAPDGQALRIAYLPAYFRDCGWQGLACITRGRNCSAHAGDSEIIVVEVRHHDVTRRWLADAIFLSAHCFGRSAGRCRWYTGDALSHFSWVAGTRRGAPRIWVAKGKHGNYPTATECDTGHWYYDSCDGNTVSYRFPIVSAAQNIGGRARSALDRDTVTPRCVAAERLALPSPAAFNATVECFWDPTMRFRGWQRPGGSDGATAYARVLAAAGL